MQTPNNPTSGKIPNFVAQKPVDYEAIRILISREITRNTGVEGILEEPETQDAPRPGLPYFSFKFTSPGIKSGDDDKRNILDGDGNPTNRWVSGGVRKMAISFHCYAKSHEEAYNYMGLWQAALDSEPVQENLRRGGVAVWVIGNVADLSQLLNTGYEGRSQLDCSFGVASNYVSDLGSMESVEVQGSISSGEDVLDIETNVP